jgi:hypothetical protein
MKFKFIFRLLMVDCGRASKMTRGVFTGALTEAGSPPFNRYS